MKLYENLKQLKTIGMLDVSIKNGVISSNYIDYISIYEDYLKLREEGEYKMQAYQKIAMTYYISVDNVRKIVAKMKR